MRKNGASSMNKCWSNCRQASLVSCLAACLATGLNLTILAILGISPAIAVGSHVLIGA
jgi:hypothetical protein